MCPSSGEITVSMRQWYFSLCMCGFLVCRPESHPYQLGAHYFLVYLFQILYMFQATMCPSSGELTVSMRHWVAFWSADGNFKFLNYYFKISIILFSMLQLHADYRPFTILLYVCPYLVPGLLLLRHLYIPYIKPNHYCCFFCSLEVDVGAELVM